MSRFASRRRTKFLIYLAEVLTSTREVLRKAELCVSRSFSTSGAFMLFPVIATRRVGPASQPAYANLVACTPERTALMR